MLRFKFAELNSVGSNAWLWRPSRSWVCSLVEHLMVTSKISIRV